MRRWGTSAGHRPAQMSRLVDDCRHVVAAVDRHCDGIARERQLAEEARS